MSRLRALAQRFGQTWRLMIGLPDYDAYVRHLQASHPEQPIPSRAEFVRMMQQRRYDGKSTNRCC